MLKKILLLVLSVFLFFSNGVMAVNTSTAEDVTSTEASQNMPNTAEKGQSGGGMGMKPSADMQKRGMPPSMPNGEMPTGEFAPPQGDFAPPQGEFTPPQGDFTPPQNMGQAAPSQSATAGNNTASPAAQTDAVITDENQQNTQSADNTNQSEQENQQFGGQMPEGMNEFFGGMLNNTQNAETNQSAGFLGFVKTYSTPVVSVVLLIFAFIFVIFYKRKRY